jgi:hypothetical protein
MKEVSQKNLGPLIAYVVPGIVLLWGVSDHSSTVKMWLTATDGASPSVAGFLYVTLASLAGGLTLNAVRSVTLDVFHHRTGIRPPELDFSNFQAKFWAFNQLVESHWRYYQFYSHMFLAVAFSITIQLLTAPWGGPRWFGVLFASLELMLLLSARETLARYYSSASLLLGTLDERPDCRRKENRKLGAKVLAPETS